MADKTNFFEVAVLNVLRGTALSAITPRVALFTADPGEAGALTSEVSGGGYARQSVTFGAPAQEGDGVARMSNSAQVTFPTATASWGTVSWIGVVDAASGGNLLYKQQLQDSGGNVTTKTINTDDVFQIPVGGLKVGEA